MNKYLNLSLDKIGAQTFTLYLISIYIFSSSSQTIIISEVIFIALIAIMGLYILKRKYIKLGPYCIFILGFTLFTMISSIWAIQPTLAIDKFKTLIMLLVMSLVIFNFFYSSGKIEYYIKALNISGIAMSVYVILYYGIGNYINGILSGERMGTEITNVNSIGKYASISVIICFYYALFKREKKYYIVSLLPFIIAMGTGSRKALVLILGGVLSLSILYIKKKNILKSIVRVISFIILFSIALQLPIFSVVTERMESLINVVTKSGEVDHSTLIREEMINAGIKQFRTTPILGVGIGNSRYITMKEIGRDTYLHNNFIEILSCGGIIGFLIYYSMYLYILVNLFQQVRVKNALGILTFIIIATQLLLDYGEVSYYSKETYIYLILGFLVISLNKSKDRFKELEGR